MIFSFSFPFPFFFKAMKNKKTSVMVQNALEVFLDKLLKNTPITQAYSVWRASMHPCISGEMTLRAPKSQQRANVEVRGHRRSLESRLPPSGSFQPHRDMKHTCKLVDFFTVDVRRKKTFVSIDACVCVFFFNEIIVFLFPLHVAQSGGRLPVLTGVFFTVVLDCREILKTSPNSLQNLASRSVGGRLQNRDGFTGKAEWVS